MVSDDNDETPLQTRTIQSRYWLGDIVFLRVADEREPGMITGCKFAPHGGLIHCVTFKARDSWHYECELTPTFVPNFEPAQ